MSNCCGGSAMIMGRSPQDYCRTVNSGNGNGCGTGTGCDPKLGPRHNRGRIVNEIRDISLAMLGAPILDLEITDQQLEIAIDYVLKVMEYYAPREYFKYYTFLSTPGKSVYEMPPDVGYVRQVYYRQTPEFAFTASDLDGSIPIEYFYPGGAYASIQGGLIDPIQPIWGQLGSWNHYKSYERMYARMSSGIGGWEFVGGYRNIKLYPIPYRAFPIIVHYVQKCSDWETLTPAMIDGTVAFLKIMIGRVRSKFVNPPGPGGGLQLDGLQILQEGNEELKQWKEDLIYKYGDGQLPIFFG